MERKYKKVVLLGVDGAGSFFRVADTPNMDKIFANGSVTYDAVTSFPSISAECWGSMLHGITPEEHKLTNTIVSSEKYDTKSEYPSVFRLIRKAYPDAVLASFCNWSPINYGIIEHDLGVYMDSSRDDELTDKIVSYINENDFDFIFVQFDSVDGAGHSNGYGTKNHLAQITTIDSYIGRIYDTLKNRNMLDDTLFMVTADHGGTPGGSHGGDSEAEMRIFIGASGKNITSGKMVSENGVSVRDIAAIVLYAFGIECPDNWNAGIPNNLFEGYVSSHAKAHRKKPVWSEFGRPLIDGEKSFDELISAGKLRSVLKFDGSVNDETGKSAPKACGQLEYVDGYDGKAVKLTNGHIVIDPYKVGADNFSVVFCFKPGKLDNEAVIIANRNLSEVGSAGFAFTADKNGIKFSAGNGSSIESKCDDTFLFPEGFNDGGWRHVILSVAHKEHSVTVIYDFEKCTTQLFDSALKTVTFDALAFCIGQDGTQKYTHSLDAAIDDMLIFNGCFTVEDAQKLKKMYEK